ncbi:unnamed protein product [Leptidea sinapis]|uniref:Insulin-like domain-containing protein n=1 Tax=Leptidea sinapis TaxID=189913 RepID=A0A5E4PSF3_9NEOP|nr:unnamed protein product [Leptidea sinapis]
MEVKYFVYIVLIILRNISPMWASEHGDTETYRMSDRVYTCSKWLSSIIDNICNNVYKIVKRETSIMVEKLSPRDLKKSVNEKRLISDGRWRRMRRQVATECCERPCTVSNLVMYCPDDAKLLRENPDIFN